MNDLLVMTFDALRFDVAHEAFQAGRTPYLATLFPNGWEPRHTPGNFTFAAHAALFAGFWPTPVQPGKFVRPFALRFPGSRTIDRTTRVLEGDNIVAGLEQLGYRTLCIGGVGFFNKRTPLGRVFPAMFQTSLWQPEFSVLEYHSTRAQIRAACGLLSDISSEQPIFLFLNLSATHSPTHCYQEGASRDSVATQSAALHYVDRELKPLMDALNGRGRGGSAYFLSDHGTLFGEAGFTGHRVGHPDVWTVPYAEFSWEPSHGH